jgi:hypothetical protein
MIDWGPSFPTQSRRSPSRNIPVSKGNGLLETREPDRLILGANAPVGALEPAVGVSNSAPDTLDHSGRLTAEERGAALFHDQLDPNGRDLGGVRASSWL